MVILAHLGSDPVGHEFVQDREGEEVVAEPPPQVLAAHGGVHVQSALAQVEPEVEGAGDIPVRRRVAGRVVELDEGAPGVRILLEQCAEDRKSTRLNSSHVARSYAVFCLKKKKTDTETANWLAAGPEVDGGDVARLTAGDERTRAHHRDTRVRGRRDSRLGRRGDRRPRAP